MAQKFRMHGFDKIEIGDCGADGAMGGSLTAIKAIVPDSVIFEVAEPDIAEIFVEGADEPDIIDIIKGGIKTISFGTRDTSTDQLELFFGGATATGVWSAPIKTVKKFQSVKLTGKSVDGNAIEISIPKVLMISKLTGNLKDTDSGIIESACKVSTPVGAAIPSAAQVIDAVTEKLDIEDPKGMNGTQITISQNSGDTLDVSDSEEGHAKIKLANTTPALNNASVIQTAIRALGSIGSTDFSDWNFTSDGWDDNVIGDILTTPNDTLSGGQSEVPLSPYQITYI